MTITIKTFSGSDFNLHYLVGSSARPREQRTRVQIWVAQGNRAHDEARAHCVWHREGDRLYLHPLCSLKQVKYQSAEGLNYLAEIIIWHSALSFTNFSLTGIHGHMFKIFFFKIYLRTWTFFIINWSIDHKVMMSTLAEFSRRVCIISFSLGKVIR